jgi:ferritin
VVGVMDPLLRNLFQSQLGKELYSAYLYYAMANYYGLLQMPYLERWMLMQAYEEFTHAEAFRRFMRKRWASPVIPQLPKPPEAWNSYRDPFIDALEHEKMITRSIAKIHKRAQRVRDPYATYFLETFLREQEEEIEAATVAVELLTAPQSERELHAAIRNLGWREVPAPFELDWDELWEQG